MLMLLRSKLVITTYFLSYYPQHSKRLSMQKKPKQSWLWTRKSVETKMEDNQHAKLENKDIHLVNLQVVAIEIVASLVRRPSKRKSCSLCWKDCRVEVETNRELH